MYWLLYLIIAAKKGNLIMQLQIDELQIRTKTKQKRNIQIQNIVTPKLFLRLHLFLILIF